ncbi:MAG TPA: hypothetical protein VNZ56_08290 [Verrucomicrobiae bacterium]|jgi:hypothetical protein|nr:hypothetical protein [Verrucomicrobiae bacterium]
MSRRLFPLFLAIFALTAMSVSLWAKNESADALTTSVKLTAPTTIGSTKLAPGDYKVVVEGGKAKFEQGSKVAAEIPCTLKDFTGKINQTTFIIDNNQLTEIQVAGKNKAIDF